MTEAAHSYWSASKFESIMLCPGKLVMEQGKPDNTSEYAAEGTAAHLVLTWALQENAPASKYIGRTICLDANGRVIPPGDDTASVFEFTVDEEMAEHVQHALDYVHDAAGDDGVILVDQRVNYAVQLGVPEDDAWGTLDVAVARGVELTVMDFKYGRGVEVEACYTLENGSVLPNPQLGLYAVGALNALEPLFGEFERIRLAISQPRIRSAASEYDLPRDELMGWVELEPFNAVGQAKFALEMANDGKDITPMLTPGEKQCRFCKAKATCPALRDEVAQTVSGHSPAGPDDFDVPAKASDHIAVADEAWLAACLDKVDLIEDWCKAIRSEAERRMLAGDEVPGYKLVRGKRGNRVWGDPKAAEEMLKTFRLKTEEMYDLKLISPTSAEKLQKAGTIGPRQWPKLQAIIAQSDGNLHVAPLSDKRDPVTVKPVADDFDDAPPI